MSHDAPLPGYTIRRPKPLSSLLPAVGVGVAVGLAAFYVTRLLLEREPILTPEERERRARALERRTGRRVSTLGAEMVGGAEDLELDERIEVEEEEEDDDVLFVDEDDLEEDDEIAAHDRSDPAGKSATATAEEQEVPLDADAERVREARRDSSRSGVPRSGVPRSRGRA